MEMRKGQKKSSFLSLEFPKRNTLRESSFRFCGKYFFGNERDFFVGFREGFFPFLSLESREFYARFAYIFGDTSELCQWQKYFIPISIEYLHIFSFDQSDTFFFERDIFSDSMFTVDDEISFFEREEEIQMFDR